MPGVCTEAGQTCRATRDYPAPAALRLTCDPALVRSWPADLADVGGKREAMLAVTIPETPVRGVLAPSCFEWACIGCWPHRTTVLACVCLRGDKHA